MNQAKIMRCPKKGRLIFILTFLISIIGSFFLLNAQDQLWSTSQHLGGISDLVAEGEKLFVSSLTKGVVESRFGEKHLFPRAINFIEDGNGGHYVLGLLSNQVGHITAEGRWMKPTEFPSAVFISGVVAADDGVWVVGFDRRRMDERPKRVFYFPEYSHYRWFIQWFEKGLPVGRLRFNRQPILFDNEFWHEESGGIWPLLTSGDSLYVVNDQAESINCVNKKSGQLNWRSVTKPRPVGAIIVDEMILVVSGQSGVVEAFATGTGTPLWQLSVGRGLSAIVKYGDWIVLTNWASDQLIRIDPQAPKVIDQRTVPGAPSALAVDGQSLWVGLDTTREAVQYDRDIKEIRRVSFP